MFINLGTIFVAFYKQARCETDRFNCDEEKKLDSFSCGVYNQIQLLERL